MLLGRVGVEVGKLFGLQFVYGLLQNLLIGFVAEVGDEAALFGPQHVAGSPDVEVLHGDVDAAAQLGEVLDCLQAAACLLRKARQRRGEEVAESFPVAPPDASAQLVQVGEAELLGIVDDDRVGIRHVDAALDDAGRNQHVVFVIDEVEDDLF